MQSRGRWRNPLRISRRCALFLINATAPNERRASTNAAIEKDDAIEKAEMTETCSQTQSDATTQLAMKSKPAICLDLTGLRRSRNVARGRNLALPNILSLHHVRRDPARNCLPEELAAPGRGRAQR